MAGEILTRLAMRVSIRNPHYDEIVCHIHLEIFFSLKRARAHTRKKEVEVSFLLVENRKDHVMVLPSTKAVRSVLSMLTVFSKEEIKAASSKESSMAE